MLSLLIALASVAALHPAACRVSGPGAVRWQAAGPAAIFASTSAADVGEVRMKCRVRIPAGTDAVTIAFDHAWISFAGAGSKQSGSGLVLETGGDCRAEVVRVAGEDWIESPFRAWSTSLQPGQRSVDVSVILRDASSLDPVRIDLQGLRVTPGRAQDAQDCPSH